MLVRSPNFADLDIPDIPTGNLAEITTRIDRQRRRAGRRTSSTASSTTCRTRRPPELDADDPRAGAADRFTEHPTASTYYFFLNQRRAAVRRPARPRGGQLGGRPAGPRRPYAGPMEPGCALLAPGVPGYDERLDTVACPYGYPPTAGPRPRPGADPPGRRRGRAGHRLGQQRPPTRAPRPRPTPRRCTQIGLDAGRAWSRRTATTRRSTTGAPMRRPGSTPGSRTSRTRSTSSSSSTATRSSQPTTRTPATSTTRWSTPRSTACDRRRPDSVVADWSRARPLRGLARRRATSSPGATSRSPPSSRERMDPDSAIFHPLYRNDYSSWRLKEGE